MALMIYEVSGNGKIDIGYVKPKNSMFKPKPKETVIKPKDLYSHFTYGWFKEDKGITEITIIVTRNYGDNNHSDKEFHAEIISIKKIYFKERENREQHLELNFIFS